MQQVSESRQICPAGQSGHCTSRPHAGSHARRQCPWQTSASGVGTQQAPPRHSSPAPVHGPQSMIPPQLLTNSPQLFAPHVAGVQQKFDSGMQTCPSGQSSQSTTLPQFVMRRPHCPAQVSSTGSGTQHAPPSAYLTFTRALATIENATTIARERPAIVWAAGDWRTAAHVFETHLSSGAALVAAW